MHMLMDYFEDLVLPVTTQEPLFARVSEIPNEIEDPTAIPVEGCILPITEDATDADFQPASWVDDQTISFNIAPNEKGRHRLWLRFNIDANNRPVRNVATIIFI